ncbi:MAG TPA: hypothetical protein VFX80_14120 [Solirubrobacteraceae bacterium]|nr:hypothetical protein [Solirubrobacteraceae bacterium]
MTRQRSFKRLVRARMEKTGESYTAARAILLSDDAPTAALATSDAAIRDRTGRGWEEWFDLLDDWGASERSHREIARWMAEQLGVDPLEWGAQAITMSYERARGGRAVGQHEDGFAVTASKTIAVPVEALYDGFLGEAPAELRERTATRPRSARFDWGEDGTRVHVTFIAKDEGRSTVAVEHRRLADADEAERMKVAWRERLAALKTRLEASDA